MFITIVLAVAAVVHAAFQGGIIQLLNPDSGTKVLQLLKGYLDQNVSAENLTVLLKQEIAFSADKESIMRFFVHIMIEIGILLFLRWILRGMKQIKWKNVFRKIRKRCRHLHSMRQASQKKFKKWFSSFQDLMSGQTGHFTGVSVRLTSGEQQFYAGALVGRIPVYASKMVFYDCEGNPQHFKLPLVMKKGSRGSVKVTSWREMTDDVCRFRRKTLENGKTGTKIRTTAGDSPVELTFFQTI